MLIGLSYNGKDDEGNPKWDALNNFKFRIIMNNVSAPFPLQYQQGDKPPLFKPKGVFPEDVFRCMT